MRLGLWYAALFVVSAGALTVFVYVLLAQELERRDHQVLTTLLSRYATQYERSGLPGLRRLLEVEATEGRNERLLIRVTNGATEVVFAAEPPDWNDADTPLLVGTELVLVLGEEPEPLAEHVVVDRRLDREHVHAN